MLDWLAALPPLGFVLVMAVGAGLLALLLVTLAVGGRRELYLSAAGRVGPYMRGDMGEDRSDRTESATATEPAQDYSDFQRLLATLRALKIQEPERQAIRSELLGKLVAQTPMVLRDQSQQG